MAVVCLVCSRLVVSLCETCVQTAVIVRSACTVWVLCILLVLYALWAYRGAQTDK